MTDADVVSIAVQTLMVTAKLCAPILVASLAVGFAVSMLQSLTQLQDATISFVPKMIAVGVVLAVAGNWMLSQLTGFTRELFEALPALVRVS